jgi:hypothetical protein
MPAEIVLAQQTPVAAMFGDDQKRDASLASSFLVVDLPATSVATFPARVYLSAGDVERAFDRAEFRPDAAIVPTNTDLLTTAQAPVTQRVLIDRVRKQPDVLRDLDDQIAAVRKPPASTTGEQGLLRIGVDTFMAHLPRRTNDTQTRGAFGAFPRAACFVATDFPNGGAIDRRELFVQDRFRKGIAGCLAALDPSSGRPVPRNKPTMLFTKASAC